MPFQEPWHQSSLPDSWEEEEPLPTLPAMLQTSTERGYPDLHRTRWDSHRHNRTCHAPELSGDGFARTYNYEGCAASVPTIGNGLHVCTPPGRTTPPILHPDTTCLRKREDLSSLPSFAHTAHIPSSAPHFTHTCLPPPYPSILSPATTMPDSSTMWQTFSSMGYANKHY